MLTILELLNGEEARVILMKNWGSVLDYYPKDHISITIRLFME